MLFYLGVDSFGINFCVNVLCFVYGWGNRWVLWYVRWWFVVLNFLEIYILCIVVWFFLFGFVL